MSTPPIKRPIKRPVRQLDTNEGVEKPESDHSILIRQSFFWTARTDGRRFPRRYSQKPQHRPARHPMARMCLVQRPKSSRLPPSCGIPMMRELFEVVHQAKQLPLPIHFGFASQGEAVQVFVATQVAKHRFDGGETLGDHAFAEV